MKEIRRFPIPAQIRREIPDGPFDALVQKQTEKGSYFNGIKVGAISIVMQYGEPHRRNGRKYSFCPCLRKNNKFIISYFGLDGKPGTGDTRKNRFRDAGVLPSPCSCPAPPREWRRRGNGSSPHGARSRCGRCNPSGSEDAKHGRAPRSPWYPPARAGNHLRRRKLCGTASRISSLSSAVPLPGVSAGPDVMRRS